jgi:hypothetical protein
MNFERQDVQRVRASNRVLDAEQIKWLRSHAVVNAPVLASGSFSCLRSSDPAKTSGRRKNNKPVPFVAKEQEYA